MTKVKQLGLTSKSGEKVEEFADRVSDYNKAKGLLAVEMEAREGKDGQWDIDLEFASRGYARDFWTDPKYDTRILI